MFEESLQEGENLLISNPAQPIVILLNQPLRKAIEISPRIEALLKYPNVRTSQIRQMVAEASKLYTQPKPEVDEDTSRLAIYGRLSSIRHDLRHALNGNTRYDKNALLSNARTQEGLQGSDEELIDQIMNTDTKFEISEFWELKAACIDWEGTLMKDGNFDFPQLKSAREEAKKRNLPLIIWSGANPNDIYMKLNELGIDDIDVCSKQDCKGIRVALAIDDMDLDNLSQEYGIDAIEFIKVN